MSVLVENVSKLYGNQKALDCVSFEIKAGEIVGFIGPNGAGKSTMMKIICGYLPPSDGLVKVNAWDVSENALEARRNIGYLPEHNPLYLEMYVREFLEFAGNIHKVKNIGRRVDEMIDMTGLNRECHKKIGALSKGYRQRVGLAQALIHNPSVLILDEPTTGLDPNQIVEIRSLIANIGKSKTVMLSTHIMQEVEAICHKVIVINKGKIVANDTAQKLHHQNKSDKDCIVLAEFGKDVSETLLLNIPGVNEVKKVNEKLWLLINRNGIDIRENIFKHAVANNLTVLLLQKQEKSLEEIFGDLTK